jgi:hypothetical protein
MFRPGIATVHCPEQIGKTAWAATTYDETVGREQFVVN